MRVYVPYGDEWYGYLMRRLAERPANLAFFLRSLATQALVSRLAVLGAGKMGEALLSGHAARRAGRPTTWSSPRGGRSAAEQLARAVRRRGAVADGGGGGRRRRCWSTVKPQDMGALLADLGAARPAGHAGRLARGRHPDRVLSRSGWPTGTPVVRVMTNTPVLVDEAMSAISAGVARGRASTCGWPRSCSRPVGKVIRVPESQQDAVTALSGSGPAYFFYLVEAMTDAGILLGLPARGRRRPASCRPRSARR